LSTIPPESTKRGTSSHLKSLNTKIQILDIKMQFLTRLRFLYVLKICLLSIIRRKCKHRGLNVRIIGIHVVPLEGTFLPIALVIVRITTVCPSFKNLLSNSQTFRQRFRNRWK